MKVSDIIEKAYHSRRYKAWAKDASRSKIGRLCFVVEGMRISHDDMLRAKVEISRSLRGSIFLSDYLRAYKDYESVYVPNAELRRRALRHWRDLVKTLRESGQ